MIRMAERERDIKITLKPSKKETENILFNQ